MSAQQERLARLVKKLVQFGVHGSRCAAFDKTRDEVCDCGLADARNELEEAMAYQPDELAEQYRQEGLRWREEAAMRRGDIEVLKQQLEKPRLTEDEVREVFKKYADENPLLAGILLEDMWPEVKVLLAHRTAKPEGAK